MKNYTLVYSESFRKSLQENISEWEYENVASLYGFDKPTYRILIGKSFAIFYRINQEERTILIGNLFKQKQMHLYF